MALQFEHRWEHALLAATVEAASKKCPECDLGRTAIQKLLYFMSVLDVPMRYSFDIYHYGPFCGRIYDDVDWLMVDNVIEDTATGDRYSNYKPSANLAALKENYAEKLREHNEVIEDVCNALSDLSPATLELLATLVFSYRWVKGRGGSGPWRGKVVEKFKSVKKDKFDDADIERWYKSLVDVKLVEA